ncbi:MAG: ribosome recycling factor [Thermodesulfobacteriota bacterium]
MQPSVLADIKNRMSKSIDALIHELSGLRTGRASVALFDGVKVDYYGASTPLSQMATISAPEPRLITIQPWDLSQLQAIEKAILASELGLTPSNDGKIIRVAIPQLTEERRREIVKVAKKYAEESKVSIRNIRREANDTVNRLEKDKEISQDENKKAHGEIQELTDKFTKKVDEILQAKEAEIMEV